MTSITSRLRQHYFNLLCLLASLTLIFSASTFMLSSNKPRKTDKNIKVIHKPRIPPHKNKLNRYPLFGEYVNNSLNNKNIPTTILNLKLIGILKASKPQESQALIKVGDSDEQLYCINDELSENTRLIRILNNTVLLRRNGKTERLSLPKEVLNTQNTEIDE